MSQIDDFITLGYIMVFAPMAIVCVTVAIVALVSIGCNEDRRIHCLAMVRQLTALAQILRPREPRRRRRRPPVE